MMKNEIYLDNNATTTPSKEVIEAVQKSMQEPLNPSSIHGYGRKAKSLLMLARRNIARFFSFSPEEVIFTSSATEALNMLILGVSNHLDKGEILTSNVEHAAVEKPLKYLETRGWTIRSIDVGLHGGVKKEQIESSLNEKTRMVVLQAVNNETGVKTDIESIGSILDERKIPFIVDGVALLGKEEITIPKGVSGISFSAHKIHGPKGVGIALIRKQVPYSPLIIGGEQERGKRAGTENLSGILGLEKAIDSLKDGFPTFKDHMQTLRDQLEKDLKAAFPDMVINGKGERVCNVSNVGFPKVDGELLLHLLDRDGVYVSMGSACSSGSMQLSKVLLNMGIPRDTVSSSIRISLSRYTTKDEIERAVGILIKIVSKLKKLVR